MVGWHWEDIAEATARVNDCLAGLFGLSEGWNEDVGAGFDLGCSYTGDVWTCRGECWVEAAAEVLILVGCVRAGAVDALSAVAGDSVVA